MEIKEINYSRSQTVQLREYEPTNVFFSAKAEVKEGEDLEKAYDELKAVVDRELEVRLIQLDESYAGALTRAAAKIILDRLKKKNEREMVSKEITREEIKSPF